MKKEKILLIDGLSILNRAYYGIPTMSNKYGTPTNAIHGFLNIILKVLDVEKPDYMAIAFDLPKPTFRHKMFDDYKGTRKSAPDELKIQTELIKELLPKMGIIVLTKEGFEADDIIGTVSKICEEKELEVTILSGDRDLLQLTSDKVRELIPKGRDIMMTYFAEDVKRDFLVSPTEFIDVKALMGDSSDNVPGVPGIGEKTATKLIIEYGSIENIYEHIDEIKSKSVQNKLREHYDLAMLSKTLVTIDTNVDIEFDLNSSKLSDFKNEKGIKMLEELELNYILKRLEKF